MTNKQLNYGTNYQNSSQNYLLAAVFEHQFMNSGFNFGLLQPYHQPRQ